MKLSDLLLHAYEVWVSALNGQAALERLDAPGQVVQVLERLGEAIVPLDELSVCGYAFPGRLFHVLVVAKLFPASGCIGLVYRHIDFEFRCCVVFGNGVCVLPCFEEVVSYYFECFCLCVCHAEMADLYLTELCYWSCTSLQVTEDLCYLFYMCVKYIMIKDYDIDLR